jgi:hypothetical protein
MFFPWKQGHSEAAEAQYRPSVHHWWDAQSKQTRQTYRQSIETTRRQFIKDQGSTRPRSWETFVSNWIERSTFEACLLQCKQVLRAYIMVHVTVALYVRSEDELADTYTYMLRWYTCIYIYIYTHTHTHTQTHTVKHRFYILARYL